ncbi:hypothetical protein [Reyranella sp.]|uniref:hypothetical protein n=1 Tax=Reyranella sp. TaxID=1929291 RepID=UPI003BA963B6
MSRRFRLAAAAVFVGGIVLTVAGGCASAWTWMTDDAHPAFRYVLPALTAWLALALLRLAWDLRRAGRDPLEDWADPLASLRGAPRQACDEVVRNLWPDAEACQRIELPPEAVDRALLRRRRLAWRILQPGGAQRIVVAPARPGLRALRRGRPG